MKLAFILQFYTIPDLIILSTCSSMSANIIIVAELFTTYLRWHILLEWICPETKSTGLMFSGVSLTSWGEGASLALAGHPSSDGVTIKMPYGVDVLHRPASHPIFSYWVG